MGKKVAVNFQIDEDLKKGMEEICRELGISFSGAVTMFIAKTVREQRIPFNLTVYSEREREKEEAAKRYEAYLEQQQLNKEE